MTYPAETRKRAIGLYLDGMDAVAVARETGASHASVSRWVNAAGVKREPWPCDRAHLKAHPDHPSHGKLSGYGAGCRCPKCKNARKVFDKKCQIRRTLKGLGR